jgi:hypothetical protein
MVSTFQFRTYVPTASGSGLGTKHVSFEPGLLINYRMWPFLTLEGEVRYWVPVGGSDFAGDVVQYGLGFTYWGRTPNRLWLAPIVELVGWTVLEGKQLATAAPGTFAVTSAAGDTVVNLNAGIRLGLGYQGEFYLGYSRPLTGEVWYKNLFRLEFRWVF